MPRRLILRDAFVAIAMAVVALWGGGRAIVEHTGALPVAAAEHNRAVLRAATVFFRADTIARTPIDQGSSAGAVDASFVSIPFFDDARAALEAPRLTDQHVNRFNVHIRPPPRAPPLAG